MRTRTALTALLAVLVAACGGDADPGPGDTASANDDPGSTEPGSSWTDITLSPVDGPGATPNLVADYIASNGREEWGTPSEIGLTAAGEPAGPAQLQFWICDSFGYGVVDATEASFLAAFWSKPLPHPSGGTDGSQTVMLRILFNPGQEVLPDVLARIHGDEECQPYDAINRGTGEWTLSTESIHGASGLRMSSAAGNESVDHATQNFVGTYRGTVFNAQAYGIVLGGETLDIDVRRMLEDVIELAVAALDR